MESVHGYIEIDIWKVGKRNLVSGGIRVAYRKWTDHG